jgi:hypothetical protein
MAFKVTMYRKSMNNLSKFLRKKTKNKQRKNKRNAKLKEAIILKIMQKYMAMFLDLVFTTIQLETGIVMRNLKKRNLNLSY